MRRSGTPGHPHPAAGNGACTQRQLQLQRQKRAHRRCPGRRPYGYSYDNIGNRKTAQEPAQELSPTRPTGSTSTPALKKAGKRLFVPTYDASGNQTLIKTSTGVWTVVYNAANRAVSFTSRDGATVVECGYDYPGTPLHEESHPKRHGRQPRTVPVPRLFTNSGIGYAGQPERAPDTAVGPSGTGGHPPLALVQDASLYCYGVDFNKNVSEVFDREGAVAAIYDYSPMEQPPAPEDSSSPSSGPPRCTTMISPWFITITAITTPETAGGSTVTPSLNREDGIRIRS